MVRSSGVLILVVTIVTETGSSSSRLLTCLVVCVVLIWVSQSLIHNLIFLSLGQPETSSYSLFHSSAVVPEFLIPLSHYPVVKKDTDQQLSKTKKSARKKGHYSFLVCGSSNAHEQSSIWVTDMSFCCCLFFFAISFLKSSTTCLQTAKALARLRLCAVSPEPLLVAYVISTFSHALAQSIIYTNSS